MIAEHFLPLKYFLILLLESLNQAAMIELKKPSVSGIIPSPLVINQIKTARHCMSILSDGAEVATEYYMDKDTLETLVVVFKFSTSDQFSHSPIDLTLLCDRLQIICNKKSTFVIMFMENPFFEIFESI